MTYPQVYHNACNALVHDTPDVRRAVARCLRHYRALRDSKMLAHCRYHFSFIGWPIRKRPNGRYL